MSDKVRLKDIAQGRSDLFKVAPDDINIDPKWNERNRNADHEAHINSLAISITEKGVLQPITVCMKDGKPWVTDGFCRLEAVKLAIKNGAEIKTIKVQVEERYANEADHVLSMLTRNSGKPLTTIEQGAVVKRLLAFGWTEEEIRKSAGYSTTHMKNLETLNGAPEDVKQLVRAGKVSNRLAMKTIKEKGDKAGEALKKSLATAQASGKSRATGRTDNGTKRVSWVKHGPPLGKFIFELKEAYNAADNVPDSIGDMINEAAEYLSENKIDLTAKELQDIG